MKREGKVLARPMNREKTSGIPRNVLVLGLVSFLTDASSDMIYPVLPLFLSEVLGSSMLLIGVIEGVAESTASTLKLLSGWLSDRLGKRKLLVGVGYGLAALAKPVLSAATAGWHVLILRFADRLGKGVRTSPRDALIADSTSHRRRGLSFGFHRALDSAGAVVGPLLAFLALPLVHGNYRVLFLIASIPALLAVAVLILFVREKRRVREKPSAEAEPHRLGFDRRFKIFIAGVAIFTLGNSSDAFLLLRARELNVDLLHIPLLWLILHLVYTSVSWPAGAISDRVGRKFMIISGLLVYALVYLGFGFASRASHAWVLFGIYGLYYGLANGSMRAYVADLVGERRRGLAFGLFHGTVGMAALPASLLFGWLWQLAGAPVAFAFGAGLALLAALIFSVAL